MAQEIRLWAWLRRNELIRLCGPQLYKHYYEKHKSTMCLNVRLFVGVGDGEGMYFEETFLFWKRIPRNSCFVLRIEY